MIICFDFSVLSIYLNKNRQKFSEKAKNIGKFLNFRNKVTHSNNADNVQKEIHHEALSEAAKPQISKEEKKQKEKNI